MFFLLKMVIFFVKGILVLCNVLMILGLWLLLKKVRDGLKKRWGQLLGVIQVIMKFWLFLQVIQVVFRFLGILKLRVFQMWVECCMLVVLRLRLVKLLGRQGFLFVMCGGRLLGLFFLLRQIQMFDGLIMRVVLLVLCIGVILCSLVILFCQFGWIS